MNRAASIVWMLTWSISFSSAMAFTKCLGPDTTATMTVFVRSLFGIVLLAPMVLKSGIEGVKTDYPFQHLMRAILSTIAMICTYYAYAHLPLATATSIGFTGPFITVLLATMVLSEQVGSSKWLLILLGYIGVLILAQPGTLTFDPAILVALLANIFASINIVSAKFLTDKESPEKITFINSCGRLVILTLTSFLFWKTPPMHDWIYLGLIGVVGTLSQYSYMRALKTGVVSLVAPFEYSRLVFAVPIGILFFSEIPTLWTFLGSMIIIVSNFGLSWVDQYRKANQEVTAKS